MVPNPTKGAETAKKTELGENKSLPKSSGIPRTSSDDDSIFLDGDELTELREQVVKLQFDLQRATIAGDDAASSSLRNEIQIAERKDAELVYARALESLKQAESEGCIGDIGMYRHDAEVARSSLIQFQLEGFWVGR